METVSLPVAEASVPHANLYTWREKRKNAPTHKIAASAFQDGSKVLEVAPIHCAGYRKRQLEKYVHQSVMSYLNARLGVTSFADEIRLEPIKGVRGAFVLRLRRRIVSVLCERIN